MYKDGKWTAHTDEAKKRKAHKTRYIKEINEGIRNLSSNKNSSDNTNKVVTGTVSIPVKEGKNKANAQKLVSFLNKAVTIVDKINPNNNGVNKIILGEETSKAWSSKGDYYKANADLVNQTKYTSDDIVYLSAHMGAKKAKSGNIGDLLGKEGVKALRAARKAGATIIIDASMRSSEAYKSNKNAGNLLSKLLPANSDYETLEGSSKGIFVKNTEDTKEAIGTFNKVAKDLLEKSEKENSDKDLLVSLTRSNREGLDHKTGEKLTATQASAIRTQLRDLKEEATELYFNGNSENLDKYIERELVDSVKKEVSRILDDPDATPLEYSDALFQAEVEKGLAEELEREKAGTELISKWKDILKEDLPKKERETALNKAIKEAGMAPKELIDEILEDRSYSKGKEDLYESIYESPYTGAKFYIPLSKKMTSEEFDALKAKGVHKKLGRKLIFVGSRKVVQDTGKLVNVTKL